MHRFHIHWFQSHIFSIFHKGKVRTIGFTLIELLIVIGILAVLTATVVLVLNPGELLKEARDSARTTDMTMVSKAVQLLISQSPNVSLGVASTVYVSIPDTSTTCTNLGLPSLPMGYNYNCVTTTNLTKIDGTGWIPIDFTQSGVQNLPALPIDPSNVVAGGLYLTYVPNPNNGAYELTGSVESKKYVGSSNTITTTSTPGSSFTFDMGSPGLTPTVLIGRSSTTDVLLPSAPQGLTIGSITASSLSLSWTAPATPNGTIINYKIYRGLTSGSQTLLTTLGNVLTYTDSGLSSGTTYYYYVTAVTSVGEGTGSAVVNGTTSVLLPSAPQGLTIGSITASSLSLSWTAPATPNGTIINYNIYRGPTSGSQTILTTVGNVLTYTDSGLSSGTTYYYKVTALTSAGEGAASTVVSGTTSVLFAATGGTITYTDSNGLNPRSSPAYAGGYTVHTFTSSGTFTVSSGSAVVSALVIGGGGGGGYGRGGGGGGGGGLVTGSIGVTPQVYSIVVGGGGAGGVSDGNGVNGGNSSFSSLSALGGGAGAVGDYNGSGWNGLVGGSGGGAGAALSTGGSGTAGQGNAGGGSINAQTNYTGGGGGGAGGVGTTPPSISQGGNGGTGLASTISGISTNYAGGGGGGSQPYLGGTGGAGGGTGGGGNLGSDVAPINGTANTGGGGGGGGHYYSGGSNGAAGGSGMVIIRYPTP